MAKIETTGWAIYNAHNGHLSCRTFETKRDTIRNFVGNSTLTWRQWKQRCDVRAVKVRIIAEIPDAPEAKRG